MKFSPKTLLALAVITTASISFTEACGGNHNHSDEQNGLCPDEEELFNGLGPDVHGRRAAARFRVGEHDFGTFENFEQSEARCTSRKPTPAEEETQHVVLNEWRKRMGSNRHLAAQVRVPVYFHIITSSGRGSVSQGQINDQMDVLNAAYAPHFQFYEAASASVTNKNNWYSASLGSNAERNMKKNLRRGDENALNIYTSSPGGGVLGWATFPSGVAFDQSDDGVVLQYNTLPRGTLAPYNEGDTLVHEAGHWLGLYHTFQSGCRGSGDFISDTPAEAGPAYGCPIGRNTCSGGGSDPVTNFMDYSDDSCMDEFTPEQFEIMASQYVRYRKSGEGNDPTPTGTTPTPPTPAPPTPAPPTPAPPTPAPPTPSQNVISNGGGQTIVVQNCRRTGRRCRRNAQCCSRGCNNRRCS